MQARVCVSEAGRFHPSLSSSLLQHANVAQAKLLPARSEGGMQGKDTAFCILSIKMQTEVLEDPSCSEALLVVHLPGAGPSPLPG